MLFFSFGGLFYVTVLLVNAIAILSEDRFLARIGWASSTQDPGFGGIQDTTSVKARIINLIHSVRTLMRVPLIIINTLVILYELLLG
ncbi:Yos1-like protein [Saccharata proteae CBS 121410]|uniref:Yos1-like protein n=1 Tax=Saccharata proteae CBS 121410 TaxID=1314787 RepID=A0A9P4HYK8_9PEZI|nr:Yos1-like protein [Saccharata proteae CBS 121410]